MSFDELLDLGPADLEPGDLEPGDDALLEQEALFDLDGLAVAMPRHLSPSSAALFEQCPRRWRLRYVEKLTEPAGEEALVGTFAHRVLELLLAEPPARRTQEQAKVIAREVWPDTEADPDYQALALDEEGARRFRWKGWLAIAGLWQHEDPATVRVAATERHVQAELDGVPFLGVVDRIDHCDDGLVVTDYKTGRAPSRRFQDDKLSQVLLYAAAVEAADGQAPSRARLVYLGGDRRPGRVIETMATPDARAGAVAALRATWDRLGQAATSGAFEPSPGPLCGWCPFAERCEEGLVEIRRRHDQGMLRPDAPGAALVA
jgi:putative RecB family exonuclease